MNTYNFQQASLDAIQVGAAKRIHGNLLLGGSLALMETLKVLLLNTAELARMSEAAKHYSIEHQGATQKILVALEQQNYSLT